MVLGGRDVAPTSAYSCTYCRAALVASFLLFTVRIPMDPYTAPHGS